jgi:hypothetical protein
MCRACFSKLLLRDEFHSGGSASALGKAMSPAERQRLIEMMWTIAYSEGELHAFEENIIWRGAELLGVPTCDRIALRGKIRSERSHAERAARWENEAWEADSWVAESARSPKARPLAFAAAPCGPSC